jgi:hypothetical protein
MILLFGIYKISLGGGVSDIRAIPTQARG